MTQPRAKPHLLYLETEDWAFCQHRLPLARAARDAGFRVGLVAPAGDKVETLRAEGFEVHPLCMRRTGTHPVEEARAIAKIACIYRHLKPDIVHHVALKPVLYGTIAARLARVPAIVDSVTGLGYVFIPGGPKRKVLRLAMVRALRLALASRRVRVVFQNPDDRALFLAERIVDAARTTIVRGSGVDVERFAPSPEPDGAPVILLASRLLRDKGVAELVQAARALRSEGFVFKVVFAGVPDPANPASVTDAELAAWVKEGVVEHAGYVQDMAALLRGAHIACLPSYREGLPLFLLEAAASGRPCVTADVPGCREAVRHGENGFLVAARDARALADGLRPLLSDPELRRRMGARGRELAVGEFSKEEVASRMLALYRACGGKR